MKPDINTLILYEDSHIIVCHKPAAVAVQTSRSGAQDMVSLLKNHLAGTLERCIRDSFGVAVLTAVHTPLFCGADTFVARFFRELYPF